MPGSEPGLWPRISPTAKSWESRAPAISSCRKADEFNKLLNDFLITVKF
jgi:hypothetical protein